MPRFEEELHPCSFTQAVEKSVGNGSLRPAFQGLEELDRSTELQPCSSTQVVEKTVESGGRGPLAGTRRPGSLARGAADMPRRCFLKETEATRGRPGPAAAW